MPYISNPEKLNINVMPESVYTNFKENNKIVENELYLVESDEAAVLPITEGGTGADNAADARVNLGITNAEGTVVSQNADFAEVGEWADGNIENEDRIGYFVCIDETNHDAMMKATSSGDIRGVTVLSPAFSGNCTSDKFDENGELLNQYDYVAVMGIVSVIDDGTCIAGSRCMPNDEGIATLVEGEHGYHILNRIDDTHVRILIEPGADCHYKIESNLKSLQSAISLKSDNTHTHLPSDIGALAEVNILTSDADIEIKCGSDKTTIRKYSSTTLNTPYSAGLTAFATGWILTCTLNSNYGTQICIPKGNSQLFIRGMNKGTISDWIEFSLSDHTHKLTDIATAGTDYVTPSGSITGNAGTATKLATARTIRTKLSSTSTASFDGSGNITPGVTGTLPISNGGTGATTAAAALTKLGAAPAHLSGTTDLTAGSSTLASGTLYIVYE